MTDSGVDRRRWALIALIATAGAASVGSIFAGLYGDVAYTRTSVDADAYSRSAIGHFGFVEWLRHEGYVPILVRSLTNRQAAGDVPLIVLEPKAEDPAARLAIASLARRDAPTLIVAPKREGVVDDDDPRWIGKVRTISSSSVAKALDRCGLAATVDSTAGESTFEHPSLSAPLRLLDAQTLDTPDLEPIVGEPGRILFGRHLPRDGVFFLSDPDLIANHAIDDPATREFLRAVFLELGWTPRPVLIDETVHGATFERDLWREAMRMPFLPLTLSAVLTAIVTILAGRRFLAPIEDGRLLIAGKSALIENTAGLHGESMSADELCRRYRAIVEADVAAHLGLPEGGSATERRARIQTRATALGKPFDLEGWQQAVREKADGRAKAHSALRAIGRLRDWKTEVMRGSTGD